MKSIRLVPFRGNEKISETLIEEVRKKSRSYGLDEVILFSTKDIVLAKWVQLKCRYGCNSYNTKWCCPPTTPGYEEAKQILSEYNEALLLIATEKCPEFYRNNRSKRVKQVKYWKGVVSLERDLFLKGYYKAFSLVGVTCGLCKECSYPNTCLFPQEKRPTVESFSIDMIETLKKLGIEPQMAHRRIDSFNYYSIILIQ